MKTNGLMNEVKLLQH